MVVSWIVWRGPAEVAFEPRYAQPKDGRSDTRATFNKPGERAVLRATADDGAAATHSQTSDRRHLERGADRPSVVRVPIPFPLLAILLGWAAASCRGRAPAEHAVT